MISLLQFREAVLEAHSVGELSSDLSQGGEDETGLVVEPILAPRLMQFMPEAAGPAHPRGSSSQLSIFNIGINVQGNRGEATPPGNWHRDRGRAAWLPDGEPSYPGQISVVVSTEHTMIGCDCGVWGGTLADSALSFVLTAGILS